jgi:hypothetical protein
MTGEMNQMKSLLETLKRERREATECLRAAPTDQSLRWALSDIQNSIAAIEAVIAELPEEKPGEPDVCDVVIL